MADLKSIAALASLTSASGFGCYLVTDYVYDNNEKIENGWIHKEDLSKKGELPNESKDKSKEAKTEPNSVVFGNTTSLDSEYRNKILGTTRKINLNFIVKPIWDKAQEWWTWSFNNKFSKVENKSKLDTIFSAINKPYSSDNNDSTALNKACDLAYKKEKTEFNKGNLVGNIGAFCTKGSTGLDVSEPEAVTYENDVTTEAAYNDGVLNKQDNKSKLVKPLGTSSDNNQLWWEWAFTKNFETNKNDRSTLFGSVNDAYSSTLNDASPTKLNQACNQAYKKNKVDLTNEEGAKLLNDIKRYCTLGKEPQNIVLPVDPKPANEPTNNRVTFSAADITEQSGYKNKLLDLIKDDYLNRFVKPLDSQNQLWWYWSYNNNYLKKKESQQLADVFNELTTGYDNTNEKSLNQACNKAYKKSKEDYKFEDNNYLLQNISDFCQTGASNSTQYLEPKSITYDAVTTTNGYTDGVLNIEENAKRLVKTEGTTNDTNEFWWKWKHEQVKSNLSGKTDPFAGINSAYSSSKVSTSLNGACDAAYKKNRDDLENDNKKILGNIKSFCIKDPSGSDLTLPKEPKVSPEPGTKNGFDKSTLNGYADKLLGKVKKTNLSKFIKPTEDNKSWWRWKFQKDYETFSTKDKLTDPFKNLNLGYDKSDSKALNQACDAAYKKAKSEYKFGETDYLIENIEKFCTNSQTTDFVTEPEAKTYTASEGTEDEYKWGVLGVNGNKTKLVKAKVTDNETWWNWAYWKLLKTTNESKTIFKAAKKGFDSNAQSAEALNKICNDAYQLDKNTLTTNADNVFNQIKKFCTPGSAEQSLETPTLPKDPRPLKERTDLTDKYKQGVAKESANQNILVDPDENNNQDWWNWAFKYLYKAKPAGLDYYKETFNGVTKGYDASSNNPKALNQACKEAYTKEKKGDNNFENLRKNIKQFCTKDQNQDVSEPTEP